MFCTQCGTGLEEAHAYCFKCGNPTTPGARNPYASRPAQRLVRVMRNKKIAGVCAGVARYFDLDPTLVRVIWLIALLLFGTGLLAYIVCWIVMPKDEVTLRDVTVASPAP